MNIANWLFWMALIPLGGTPIDDEQQGIPVTAETVIGTIETESPQFVDEQLHLTLQGKPLPIRDVLSLTYSRHLAEAQPRDQILLRDGTLWSGQLKIAADSEPDFFAWITPSLVAPIQIHLDDLVQYRSAAAPALPFQGKDSDSDLLLTSDGAQLAGILEALEPTGVQFDDSSLGQLSIPWGKVVAFRLVEIDPDEVVVEPGSVPVRVMTLDGSSVVGSLDRIDSESILLHRSVNQQIALPLARVLQIHFEMGRVVQLASRQPIQVEEGIPGTDWFPWKWRKNLNVLGKPMQIGARTFAAGIGVHSLCRLTYEVTQGDQFLVGIAGMDASSRPPDEETGIGCATFSILVDGEAKFAPGSISWKDPGVDFRIPLADAKRFTLVVDLGPGHHILDRANWAMVRIVRE
ncbi:MAG: NPCBM/NEW2 domain-containing protein [Planctomycetota bacterium]|nr:NPCBM/NEW2 domain-containing protein [Planctomycetota bacterium]